MSSAWRYLDVWLLDVLVVGVVVICAVLGLWRLRPAYSVYMWASLAMPLAYPFPSRPLLSMPRFTVVIFPAFWVLADQIERRRLSRAAVVAVLAGSLALCTVLFVNWYDIF